MRSNCPDIAFRTATTPAPSTVSRDAMCEREELYELIREGLEDDAAGRVSSLSEVMQIIKELGES